MKTWKVMTHEVQFYMLFDFQFYICSYLHRLTPQWSRQFLISCCLSIYQVHGLFWLMISWSKCTGLLLPYACVLLQFSLLALFLMCEHKKKGVPSAVGFPHCAGSGEGLSLSPKPYPHKCVEAGARTRDLPVTDGRLYRCTRPALLIFSTYNLWKL